jgi:hypothetical protein
MAKPKKSLAKRNNSTDIRKKPRPIQPTGGGQVGTMTGTGGGTS